MLKKKAAMISDKFRSKFERRLAAQLDHVGVPYLYECRHLDYVCKRTYTPDFELPNGVILEAKGFFKPADRTKMLAVKKAHPGLDIRFVFQANNKLSKSSKTTYGAWADKHGFPWCIGPSIPESWLK
jgi:hypothetical protein